LAAWERIKEFLLARLHLLKLEVRIKDCKVNLDYKDLKEKQVRRDQPDLRDLKEKQVQPDLKDHPDLRDHLDLQQAT
jgi:hypothetical protein